MKVKRDEVRNFNNRQELMEYLKYRSEHDKWVIPFINEIGVVHIPNEPLFINQYCKNTTIDKNGYTITLPSIDSDKEEVMDCITSEGGFFMATPFEGKMAVIPMTEYAYTGTCQRTGDDCPTMMRDVEGYSKKVLPSSEKAARLTRDASLYGDSCKMLLRDGYIQTNRSKEFVPFDDLEYIERLEQQLALDHSSFTFDRGQVSREYLMVEYLLNDIEMEETVRLALNDAGADIQELKAGVRLSTSDIGMSAMRVALFYDADGIRTVLDGGVTMEHKGDASADKFADLLVSLGEIFKDCENRIEELGNMDIDDVAECISRIREKATFLPKSAADTVEENCRVKFPNGGTAIDVYLALNEIIQVHASQTKVTPTRYINLSEQVAKLMKLPFDKIDAGEAFSL